MPKTINNPSWGTIPMRGPRSYGYYLNSEELRELRTSAVSSDWLEPNREVTNQKSFYKRAYVVHYTDGLYPLQVLYSYNTPVAALYMGECIRLWGGWSATTSKHFQSFFGARLSKKEWEEMPVQDLTELVHRARDAH